MRMLATLLIAAVITATSVQGQTRADIEARLDSLNEIRAELREQLSDLERRIQQAEGELAKLNYEEVKEEGIEVEVRNEGKLRPNPTPHGEHIATISSGIYLASDYRRGYWLVHTPALEGWVSDVWIINNDETRAFIEQAELSQEDDRRISSPPSRERSQPQRSRSPSRRCCKICRKGKACGDSCIARNKTCRKGAGCACNG